MQDEYENQSGERPQQTYELRISFDDSGDTLTVKETVKVWLAENGVESFVEGVVDEIDVEYDYSAETDNKFEEFGGDSSPLSIYKYDIDWLKQLKQKLLDEFPGQFVVEEYTHDTSEWTEGWKESFKPIETDQYYVRPPWEPYPEGLSKHDVVIDPGMAFGTGQHATTKLCLMVFEELLSQNLFDPSACELLDCGTGSGILSVAAKKSGVFSVTASDIDRDAVISAKNNANANDVVYRVYEGSVLKNEDGKWNFIFANILSVVLRKILPDLARELGTGGLLVMSGIISEEKQEMIERAQSEKLSLVTSRELDGWVCLVMKK